MPKQIGDGDRTDFDETRRLLYMALVRQRTEKYELAGTLINALAHHHDVDASVPEITGHVIAVIEGTAGEAATGWIQDQIDRISSQLGD